MTTEQDKRYPAAVFGKRKPPPEPEPEPPAKKPNIVPHEGRDVGKARDKNAETRAWIAGIFGYRND
jgi:hypothetical protein